MADGPLKIVKARITPAPLIVPAPIRIFVFGSNLKGLHGKGAALDALKFWGAVKWQGRGLQGRSWAIPTKDRNLRPLSLSEIEENVHEFKDFALPHFELLFLVTRVGCGYAGKKDHEMAPMFAGSPSNCEFDPAWAAFGLKTWRDWPKPDSALSGNPAEQSQRLFCKRGGRSDLGRR